LTAGLKRIAAEDSRIGDIRGPGLMVAVEFVKDRETREPDGAMGDAVIARCLDDGLVLLTCGPAHNIVRWIPPLNVSSDEITEAVEVFEGALAAV
jgi:4-aminobutyrate aminotransferase-like enzyme